ncbi:MAG: hypothetical protein EON59_04960 [Alphaproteobacteria bacterium]|nr:MAG: hypothetical protein EON59_04960 [Alphaproteobacteria bacterium]
MMRHEKTSAAAEAAAMMTPLEVRQAGFSAEVGCDRCRRRRTLRLALIPDRWQRRPFSEVPLRCMDCGERAHEVIVQVQRGGRFEEHWRWTRPLDQDGL